MSGNARRWRAGIVRRLPASLVIYPFECMTALVSGIMGFALLTGSVRPDSLFSVLPLALVVVYGVAALLGAGTTAFGVARRNPFVIALGLRLMAMVLGVYGIAVIGYSGWKAAGFAGVFFIAKALTSLLRSLWLRAEADVRQGLTKEGR